MANTKSMLVLTLLIGMYSMSPTACSQEVGAIAKSEQIPTKWTADVKMEVLKNCATRHMKRMDCMPILAGQEEKGFTREEKFDSWALFLICSPKMLKQSSTKSIAALFEQFSAFGKALGPDNAAVWFVKRRTAKTPDSLDNLDIDRSVRYCSKFQLDRAQGPHIVITKTYPKISGDVAPSLVVKLGGLSEASVQNVLTALTTQVGNEHLDQSEMDHAVWIERLKSACEKAIKGLGDVVAKVKVSVELKGVKVSIEPTEKAK